MIRIAVLCWMATFVAAESAFAQTVFIVRHAERADGQGRGTMMADDPDLSPAGRDRALSLAATLRDADIRAIYSSDVKRTQQTAAPLAEALRLRVQTVPAREIQKLLDQVRLEKGNVVIVGHSNTIPEILAALGVTQQVKIADNEYDNLFIVVRGDTPSLVRLRYR